MEMVVVSLPFSAGDLSNVESMLRINDPLVASPSNIKDLYDIGEYVINAARREATLHVQVDNNVISTATSFARGGCISSTESEARVQRTTAALLAFLIIGGFELEPNIALYEQAWRLTHQHSLEQLELFRIADHIHPQSYIDIALSRTDRIEPTAIAAARTLMEAKERVSRQKDFRHVLQNWRVTYHALLKLVEIERGNGSHRSKAMSFIDWMANDHFFSLVPTVMGLLYLSPNRPGGLIKRAGSERQEKVSAGLQNAAWDCVYLKQWVDRVRQSTSNEIWFFSSMDSLARLLAKTLMTGAEKSDEEMRRSVLSGYWQSADVEAIWERFATRRAGIVLHKEARKVQVMEKLALLDADIRQLESRLGLPPARLST